MALSGLFQPCDYDALPGWVEDDHLAAFDAFSRCARHVEKKPYKTGRLGVTASAFGPAFAAARANVISDASTARGFFEAHFTPCRIEPETGSRGFVTGYFEPIVQTSRERTDTFRYPAYGPPNDLVAIDDTNRPAGMDPYLAFARQMPSGIEPYPDRQAIEQGALEGQGLEIAWFADRVELFLIHVQGSARLQFTDGGSTRITYAAKAGHRFTGPGGVLADLGEIPRQDVTMQSIKAWFRENPDRIDDILWQNQSFIFFREAMVDDPSLGPIAAAKVPLTPGRSIAVDRELHTFSTPIYINAPDVTVFDQAPFARLMIAQDTGSAIVGPARGDLFAGSGANAGEVAGVVKHDADFFALLPHDLVPERA